MANLTIKNVPEPLVHRLKAQAVRHRRSLNLEVINCLETATGTAPVDPEALLAHIRAVRPKPRGLRLTEGLLTRMKASGRL